MRFKQALFALLFSLQLGVAQTSPDPDFDALSHRAATALSTNPAEAAGLYKQCVEKRPDWAEGWFYLGAALFQTGQFTESKQAFQKAAALVPNRGTVWAFLGLAENQIGETSQALADLRKGEAIGLADEMKFIAAVRDTAAAICIQSGDFSGAVLQLRELARQGERSDTTLDELGVSVLGLPMLTAAIPAAKRTLIRDAGEAAWAFYAQRSEEAASRLDKLVNQYPDEPGVHYLYGIYLLARDKDAARREFGKELHLVPRHVAARLQIAMLDVETGKPEEAGRLAKEAAEINPQDPLAFLIMGRAALNEKRFADAVPALQTAAHLSPENAEAHLYLEQAYRRLGKPDQARQQHEEFVRRKAATDPTIFGAASGALSKAQ